MKEKIVDFPDRSAVQAEAALWLVKLDGDAQPTAEMLASLREWLARSPVHREELRSLAGTWSRMNVLTELAVPLGKLDTRKKIFFSLDTLRAVLARCERRAMRASVLFFAAVLSTFAFWPQYAPHQTSNGVYATQVGEQKTVILVDGSVVLLNTNSEVMVDYSQGFRDIRLLRGEVEFTVAKNPDMPFRVYAGKERVQALGTAFTVYMQDSQIDVTVTEGQVALATVIQPAPSGEETLPQAAALQNPLVSPQNQSRYVETLSTLRAGQSATMNTSINAAESQISAIETIEVIEEQDMARRLSWREGLLIFAGDPLEDVVREVSRYTTVAIEISDPQVRAIKIGGQFPVGATDAMLETLEANFGLRVTRLGPDRVLLSAAEN